MKDCKIIGFKEYRIFLWFTIYRLGQTECGILKNLYIQADKRVEEGHKMPIGKKFSPSAVWQWQWCTHQRPPQSASVPGRLHSAQCATVRQLQPQPYTTPVTSAAVSGAIKY